eukprot:12522-Amphidinium_carterae.2
MKLDMGATISHEAFMEMISPNFDGKAERTDIMAVLKRTHVIVLGDNAVYLRTAGEVMKEVTVVPYEHGVELLHPDCKTELGKFKEGDDLDAGRFEVGLNWSLRFLNKVVMDENLEMPDGNEQKPMYLAKRPRTSFQVPGPQAATFNRLAASDATIHLGGEEVGEQGGDDGDVEEVESKRQKIEPVVTATSVVPYQPPTPAPSMTDTIDGVPVDSLEAALEELLEQASPFDAPTLGERGDNN